MKEVLATTKESVECASAFWMVQQKQLGFLQLSALAERLLLIRGSRSRIPGNGVADRRRMPKFERHLLSMPAQERKRLDSGKPRNLAQAFSVTWANDLI